MYIVDTHVHTAETSPCGKIPGAEVARIYAAAGYDAIAITDHYFDGLFARMGEQQWTARIERFLTGYRAARAAGERLGLRVVLGLELRVRGAPNDYLVFGPDEEWLLEHPALYELSMEAVRDLIDEIGGVVVVAHPFRANMAETDPATVHGVEVMNGHPNHEARNGLALEMAERHGLLMTGGSDAHFPEGALRARMSFAQEISDGLGLAAALRAGEATEIVGPDGFRLPLAASAPRTAG